MPARTRARATYLALALGTIGLGLWVHRGGGVLGPLWQDVLGDALWATMMFWWCAVFVPDAPVRVRSAAALMICFGVEFSQLIHGAGIDAARATALGRLVLGSGFDPRDLAAYGLGVLGAVAFEAVALPARRPG